MPIVKYKAEPKLGEGIFTIPDAAFILNLPKDIVRRWIKNYWECTFLENGTSEELKYTWGISRNKAFNFYTLVEIIAVFSLRKIGVSFNKIKIAHNQLINLLNTPYPFATSKLISDGGVIFWDYDESILVDLDKTLQLSFKKIINPFCKKLDFSENTNLAQRFWPLGKEHSIVVDPHHCFGQPTLFGTNITTESIIKLLHAGEEKFCIAEMYNLNVNQIEDVELFDYKDAA